MSNFVYNLVQPLVDKNGRVQTPWNFFFQQFTQAPPPFAPFTPVGSPFEITPNAFGHFKISGGTVSAKELLRGDDVLVFTGELIPISLKDTLRVTYSVAPTITFIPWY